ncbi:MAG: TRIC cation channel family protein [Blautia wexlerae]
MDYQSIITFFMEMAGTVAFAASGAMVGVERNMDIFGVSVLGCSYSCRRRYDPGYCAGDYST